MTFAAAHIVTPKIITAVDNTVGICFLFWLMWCESVSFLSDASE